MGRSGAHRSEQLRGQGVHSGRVAAAMPELTGGTTTTRARRPPQPDALARAAPGIDERAQQPLALKRSPRGHLVRGLG